MFKLSPRTFSIQYIFALAILEMNREGRQIKMKRQSYFPDDPIMFRILDKSITSHLNATNPVPGLNTKHLKVIILIPWLNLRHPDSILISSGLLMASVLLSLMASSLSSQRPMS